MKSKVILLSASGAAIVAVGFSLYITSRPTTKERVSTHREQVVSAQPRSTPPARPSADPEPIFSPDRKAAGAPLAAEPVLLGKNNVLGIRPEFLRDAQTLADEMAANLENYKSGLRDPGYFNQSMNIENPGRKLALRLGLDPNAAKAVEDVLSAYLAKEIEARIEAEGLRMEREGQLLKEDKESYVNYLALHSMVSRGETLSPEQAAFYEKVRRVLEPEKGSGGPMEAVKWHECPEVLGAMKPHLSAAQQTEIAAYIEEQKRREQEIQTMQAYMRSGMIAEKLGLNDEDRRTLYEYLQDNPSASRSELAKFMTPELGALLPEGM